MDLKERISKFRQPKFANRKRNKESYVNIAKYAYANLDRLCKEYNSTVNNEDSVKLIRTDDDQVLRMFHKYCIKERIGSHYIEIGVDIDDAEFEHMVPNTVTLDLLLHNVITVTDACNMPTCTLSKERHNSLREKGWGSKTPDIYEFWKRYEYCFEVDGQFTTWDGIPVDVNQTLLKHLQTESSWI